MAATVKMKNTELAILTRMIGPDRIDLNASAARAFLKIDFEESDHIRMSELSQKAREGTLSSEEQEELDGYELLGHFLGLLHSKARKSLKKQSNGL